VKLLSCYIRWTCDLAANLPEDRVGLAYGA
jgi:hypothetical protein